MGVYGQVIGMDGGSYDACWLLVRDGSRDDGRPVTLGRIELEDRNLCQTAELPWLDNKKDKSCIDSGLFEIVRHPTEPTEKLRLKDVEGLDDLKGRTTVNIEIGNWPTGRPSIDGTRAKPESHGCVFPGADRLDSGVSGSAVAMKVLIRNANKAWARGRLFLRVRWEDEED